jgi:hypothetical protein
MASPEIQTYHCHCTTLVFSTTHKLSQLPRRASPSVDKAIILPLNSPPALTQDVEEDGDEMDTDRPKDLPELGYTILLSLSPDRRHTIIRREDGFEKRILYRCERCLLVVGYTLDDSHFSEKNSTGRTKVLYVLPGGVMSTRFLTKTKQITEGDVLLSNGNKTVAAWE